MTKTTIKALKKRGEAQGIEKYEVESVWLAIQQYRDDSDQVVEQADIKGPEWEVLSSANPPTDYPHFMSTPVAVPDGFKERINRVLLLERLREVNALIGFTRVESPDESIGQDHSSMAPLSRSNPEWVPACEVHGEGIFIQFNESALKEWEGKKAVSDIDQILLGGHRGWRNARHLSPDGDYPGIRYAMLHTLAHLLIRELALECGYNAASIRERVYADIIDDMPQAGILIYTAAADSDGTLGGLVELGKPENLGRLQGQALERAKVCSSDPLCSEHDPAKDRTLHAAACHACSFVAETSCERGNRYLDRALLIPTFEHADAGFFKGF
jgi:hypothetical protein